MGQKLAFAQPYGFLYNGNYIHENCFSFGSVSVNKKHIAYMHFILSLYFVFTMVSNMITTDEELYDISKIKCEGAQRTQNYNVKQLRYEDRQIQNSGQTVF